MKTDHGIPDCQLYQVMTALRGPDDDEGHDRLQPLLLLKVILTTRLRSILFISDHCYGLYNDTPFQLEDLQRLEHSLRNCRQKDSHFLEHLIEAVEVTFSHRVWGGYALDIITRLTQKRAEIDKLNMP